MKWIISALLAGFSFITLQAQETVFQKELLDQYFQKINEAEQCMLSVAIHQNGVELYTRAIGWSDLEGEKLANTATRYRIGSISKTFTAVLVLQQVEAGKLRLDQKLADFFPDFQNAHLITIEHLLRHRSGLHNFTNDALYETYNEAAQSREDMLSVFRPMPIDFQPDETAKYSNTNYVLLSYILEDVSGKSYGELLEKKIIKPLKLKHTKFSYGVDKSANEAWSYQALGVWTAHGMTHSTVPMGAGALQSTPSDLNKFYRALFQGELLQQSTLDQMIHLVDGYGMGIFTFPYYENEAYGHTGGIDAYSSMSGYFQQQDLAVSATSNGCKMSLNDIMIKMLDASFGKTFEIPEFAPSYQHTMEELTSMTGSYGHPMLPFKIIISVKGQALMATAAGQPAFPLACEAPYSFAYDQAGIKIQFEPENNKMIFEQGQRLEMTRD